jgi:hypothetical protein
LCECDDVRIGEIRKIEEGRHSLGRNLPGPSQPGNFRPR